MSLDDLKKIPYGKTAIELKNISLAFGGVKALTDVSFDIIKGEVFAIIGPNGAGKSSMLNVINGFYKPTSGVINFAGTDRKEMEPEFAAKSGIARTFQNIALFKGMSTLDNLMTGRLLKQKQNFLMQALYFGAVEKEEVNSFVILANNATPIFAQVSEIAQSKQWPVTEFHVNRGQLEDVFRSVTAQTQGGE